MSKTHRDVEIDYVADFLKMFTGKVNTGTVHPKPDDVQKALEYHNKIRKDLQELQTWKDNELKQQTGRKSQQKTREDNARLQEEKQSIQNQLKELQHRFSKLAGDKLVDNNPNITDLSDQHRPTKLAEQFRSLYDDAWTDAFEEFKDTETKTIEILVYFVKKADTFCGEAEKQQMKSIFGQQEYTLDSIIKPTFKIDETRTVGSDPSEEGIPREEKELAKKGLRELRKSLAHLSIVPFCQIFADLYVKGQNKFVRRGQPITKLTTFCNKLVGLLWLMKLQEPPIELVWATNGGPYRREMFAEYNSRGSIVIQTVWPAVILHNTGPLMTKGIVRLQK